jgi:hypothetical protein
MSSFSPPASARACTFARPRLSSSG